MSGAKQPQAPPVGGVKPEPPPPPPPRTPLEIAEISLKPVKIDRLEAVLGVEDDSGRTFVVVYEVDTRGRMAACAWRLTAAAAELLAGELTLAARRCREMRGG